MGTLKGQLNLYIPELKSIQHINYRCTYILNDVGEPWDDPTLSSVKRGSDDIETDVKIEPDKLRKGSCSGDVLCSSQIISGFFSFQKS